MILDRINLKIFLPAVFLMILLFMCIFAYADTPPATLIASWYSVESLKQEGTWKFSKGRMANGELFQDDRFTAATRLYPLGSWLLITNLDNGKIVAVKVTDRISKRFAKKRIDLSKRAFSEIANLKQGIISVKVELIK